MPSPIGHALGGAVAGLLLAPRAPAGDRPPSPRRLFTDSIVLWAVVAACAPDLDFLWGRHNMETHSLGAALATGLAAWVWSGRPRLGIAMALAWTTHVAFDWLGSDDTPPLGVMALWPLTSTFYFADAFVFDAISRRYWREGFWAHNLGAVVRELAILVPGLALALWWHLRRRRAVAAG
jgi:LexA-binding, inner membrane-associated putative hydrolase